MDVFIPLHWADDYTLAAGRVVLQSTSLHSVRDERNTILQEHDSTRKVRKGVTDRK